MMTARLKALMWIAVALVWASPVAGGAESRKPNIILILADDLGYECLGANGGETYKTPVLDTMAQQGLRFEHCYAQPLCTPSRVQIMTGQYNVRNYRTFGLLEKGQTTFAHLLKQAGYATCMAGKWQLGGRGSQMTEMTKHFGFDESYLYTEYYYWNSDIVVNGETRVGTPQEYGPEILNGLACRFIEQNKTRPFFLYYTMSLPHGPFLPTPDSGVTEPWRVGDNSDRPEKKGPKGITDMFKKGDPKYYADMVAYMDKLVGRLLAKLDESGLRENTLVIFTGDNGSPTGQASSLRGRKVIAGKSHMTDAGTHVPLIVRWPAVIQKPAVCDDLVDFTDFLPTFCEVAGATMPADLKSDGQSFLPRLRGEGGSSRQWSYCWYAKKYPALFTPKEWARNQRYKLYRSGEFYDVSADPLEKKPLAELSPEATAVKTLLQQALDQYRDARPAQWVAEEKRTAKEW